MVWYGMVWYGMVWYGMVWYGMECFHSKYNVLELIMLPSDVCSLDIEDLVEDSDTLILSQGLPDIQRLSQDFIDPRHRCCWGVDCWQVAHSILHHKFDIADEDVTSSPTADGLVFFGVCHPSKQPSQVIDLASWTCLSGFTSYYVVALVR